MILSDGGQSASRKVPGGGGGRKAVQNFVGERSGWTDTPGEALVAERGPLKSPKTKLR